MNKLTCKKIVFHGAIVLMLGMLSGIPFAMTILEYIPGNSADWKLSHMEGLINGLLMLAVAACGGLLSFSVIQARLLYWSILFTGYSNALYGWARGLSGETGLDFAPPIGNQIAALLGGLPIFTAFCVVIMLMIGSYKAHSAE